jgi:hypothetical protein
MANGRGKGEEEGEGKTPTEQPGLDAPNDVVVVEPDPRSSGAFSPDFGDDFFPFIDDSAQSSVQSSTMTPRLRGKLAKETKGQQNNNNGNGSPRKRVF